MYVYISHELNLSNFVFLFPFLAKCTQLRETSNVPLYRLQA